MPLYLSGCFSLQSVWHFKGLQTLEIPGTGCCLHIAPHLSDPFSPTLLFGRLFLIESFWLAV